MAEPDSTTTNTNGVSYSETTQSSPSQDNLTLYTLFNRFISAVFFPDPKHSDVSLFQRAKTSVSDNLPLFRDASKNSADRVLLWTRRGSPLRALLVVSVGTISLLTLTGLSVFMLFFAAATVNAVVISLLMTLAAAGGFLALFFTCVAAIYVAALSVAVFVISTATISAVIAVLIATGWIGFFCMVWLAARKSLSMAKYSVTMTGSALSAYSTARHTPDDNVSKKSE